MTIVAVAWWVFDALVALVVFRGTRNRTAVFAVGVSIIVLALPTVVAMRGAPEWADVSIKAALSLAVLTSIVWAVVVLRGVTLSRDEAGSYVDQNVRTAASSNYVPASRARTFRTVVRRP